MISEDDDDDNGDEEGDVDDVIRGEGATPEMMMTMYAVG